MNYFSTIVYLSFALWIIRTILFWVALWQYKEYRLDRLLVHFRETIQGRHIFFSSINGIKWTFFFLFGVVTIYEKFSPVYEISSGIFFILQGLFVIKDILQHRIKRPVFTGKAMVLTVMNIGVFAILFLFPLMTSFVWLLVLDFLLPWVVSLFVFFLAFPTEILEDIKIEKAREKMQQFSHTLVIAVSGSYGKTSTKEYIAQVLSQKFRVVKTPGSNNTPIGIANTILTKIQKDTEIFVVEMGAYKRGEIAQLTRIVQPKISVTTAISDQHISLYGNLENVIVSEYELIQALPKDGLALFNKNSKHIKKLYSQTKVQKIFYEWFHHKPQALPLIGAYNIQITKKGIEFTVILKRKEFICHAPLFGMHVVENILPAIFLAQYLGFTKEEIVKAVNQLQPPPHTMMKETLTNGVIAMDDTFNISPESVIAALDFLKTNKGKKILVLAPLTELGKSAGKHAYNIGRKASTICDDLFLLNKNFSKEIIKGVRDGKGLCNVQIARPEIIAKMTRQITKKGDMVIFEGKETKMVMRKLL